MCDGNFWFHYPKTFISETDWKTSIWAGQILGEWGPKNAGSAATISYTLSIGSARATIQYSIGFTEPYAPYYEWFDISDPPYGIAKAEHNVKVPWFYDTLKLINKQFTVEPSSIGFLDPNKDGGYLPMIITHTFTTYLNTGDSATIKFGVRLWTDKYEEIPYF
jgi:hypothetical protein